LIGRKYILEEYAMNLIVAGDLVPTRSNMKLFEKALMNDLLGDELLSIWSSADIRIINLETPLTDSLNPILKSGPNLSAPVCAINGIKALNPSVICLANNHILDQGEQGLNTTIELLTRNQINYVGAGGNLYEACKPLILNNEHLKIGIYACSENEFSIATDKKGGANPFDPLESLDHINELKKKCDYVIVLYHGGKEHYRYPSPYLQKVCKRMVEKGADIVICQHSHSIGCFETYHNSTIIYGQGNFVFDYSENECWETGILVKVIINNGLDLEYIPIVKSENAIRLAKECEKKEILDQFNRRSSEILNENFVIQNYMEFSKKNIEFYLRKMSGFGKWLSRLDRYILKGHLLKIVYNKKKLLELQNYIECEAHRELVIEGLKNRREADKL
jgi:poly-gamma-glutamate capsule biosynthesis protein CapA/YwtB (metallophosphatase superfamily)